MVYAHHLPVFNPEQTNAHVLYAEACLNINATLTSAP